MFTYCFIDYYVHQRFSTFLVSRHPSLFPRAPRHLIYFVLKQQEGGAHTPAPQAKFFWTQFFYTFFSTLCTSPVFCFISICINLLSSNIDQKNFLAFFFKFLLFYFYSIRNGFIF